MISRRSILDDSRCPCTIAVMVTNGQHVILPDTPLFLVDRSWRAASSASTTQFDWQSNIEPSSISTFHEKTDTKSTDPPRIVGTTPKARATGRQSKSEHGQIPETARAFEFINATRFDHARDPHVQRLVKSHVRKGISRHRDLRVTSKAKTITGSDSKGRPTYVQEKLEEATGLVSLNWGTICSGSASPFYGNKANDVLSGSRPQCLLSYCISKLVYAIGHYPIVLTFRQTSTW